MGMGRPNLSGNPLRYSSALAVRFVSSLFRWEEWLRGERRFAEVPGHRWPPWDGGEAHVRYMRPGRDRALGRWEAEGGYRYLPPSLFILPHALSLEHLFFVAPQLSFRPRG